MSRLENLHEILEHISNLTDQLVPVWLIWVVAALTVTALPGAVIFAFYRAIREDESGASAV